MYKNKNQQLKTKTRLDCCKMPQWKKKKKEKIYRKNIEPQANDCNQRA